MPWIETIAPEKAQGLLARIYQQAVRRAGRIWNILSIMSLNPKTAKSSMHFYRELMFGDSPLSRGQREMLAVVVSRTNHCCY